MKNSKINIGLVSHLLSVVVIFESLFMLFAVIVSLIYKETIIHTMFLTFLATAAFGILLNAATRKYRRVEPSIRESFVIVTFSWLTMGLVGTLPYITTASIPDFTNAFFESVSGFTTTGSSILSDIEALPKSILFWRAETHWIGGMGIIVLVVAIMPFLKMNGIYLFYSEASSVDNEKMYTRMRYVARNLWFIYLGLTGIETLLLWAGGMTFFDSVCHSFATIATGGFSTKNDSLAGYSPYIQYVVTIFMLLSGINFTVHALAIRGNFKNALKNEELRLYLKIIFVVGGLITALLVYQHHEISFEQNFRAAFFQVVSVLTATGFATADYLEWPVQAIGLIAILMLIGASSGSTGGGVKVIRHLIVFKRVKILYKEVYSPNVVRLVRYNGRVVHSDQVTRILAFVITYYAILILSTLIMMIWTSDFATSFGAVATSMAGIGPGFGSVGPASNFLHLPMGSKYFLAALMIIGRLEIYSVLILFTPTFWRY